MFFRKKDTFIEPDSTEGEHVRSEQVSIAYQQAFASVYPLLLGSFVVYFFFYQSSLFSITIVWFLSVLITLIWRVLLLKSYQNHIDKYTTSVWERQFKYVMFTSAALWGSVAFFIYQTPNTLQQFFLIFLIAGIASIASGTLASLFSLAVIFLFILLAPLFTMMWLHGGFEFHMMGILVAVFFVLLVSASKRIHSNILSALVSKILYQKATEALNLSEERFETIFKEAPAGIFYYDNELMVIETNNEMLQILKISREKMIGLDLKTLPDTSLNGAMSIVFDGQKGYYEGYYTTMFNKLRLWIILRTTPIYDAQQNVIGGVAIVTDRTDKIIAEEKIKHQAYFDSLTDIPNRILLKDRIEQSLAHYRRYRSLVAVMFLDLDHFKSINDSLGHHVGDVLLVETAKRLNKICREGDTVARLGGDEFVILINELGIDPHIAAKNVESIAEKIHQTISFPFLIDEQESICTAASIGIVLVSSDEQNADDLLKFADTAMYQAKKEGRNTTRFYQEQMDQWIKKRLFMENALRHSISNGELELYYQPLIEVSTKKIIGAEALLRWNHPDMGLIMPDDMISIAEESGLIVPIGEWVMRKACTQFNRLQSKNTGISTMNRIAINVSAIQFRQADFVDKTIRIINESGIPPYMVEIELTESTVIDKIDSVIEKMGQLRAFGIGISMDDFGTGYSSLAYLKRLPFSTLKIDRSFIRDIMNDSDDAVLVQTIIAMASIFKLDVIAEGVETIEQFEFLERHGCQYFQGFLCSKPVQVQRFEELLSYDVQSCQTRH
ncbi:MAG: EAL domain-containing protein [Sulfuricurvum sp.]|nr:EAL domain-containing protein [Sulfuricurvum sp.]